MSLLFLSAISIEVFSVSATGAPCCSPAVVPEGCAVAVAWPPGACSTAAVCPCTFAPNVNNNAAPAATAILFLIPRSFSCRPLSQIYRGALLYLEGPRPANHALLIPQRLNRLQLGRLIRRQI